MKNNLKVERAIKNITQEELAKKIGVTRQAIIDRIKQICTIYHSGP